MDIFIQASQFILSLSLLIILHELGHFIPAKLFGIKVEKFYLFFDPYFSLVRKKIGDTEYGIGWLPLGGYVKIAGMVDESMDTEQLKREPQDWEFRSKPAWQRLIVMIGGVTVNIILAIIIYMGMLMYWGEEYLPTENLVYGVTPDSTAQEMGFLPGDKILSVNGKFIPRFNEVSMEILLAESGYVEVEREGKKEKIYYSEDDVKNLIRNKTPLFGPRFRYVVGQFTDDSPAKAAGLEAGDEMVGINGEELLFFDQYLERIPQLKGEEIALHIKRAGVEQVVSFQVPESGKLGVYTQNPYDQLETEALTYGFFASIPASFIKAQQLLGNYIRQFKLIINPKTEAYKEVGGFIMIANQFDTKWNWERFWAFTAFLSIMLAFLNILPIPALDGGHVVFVLIEMISGRKPSQKVLEYAQMFGFFILLGLIVLANGNDIMRLFQ